MKKNRYIVRIYRDSKGFDYGVYAFTSKEAEILVQAYCILHGLFWITSSITCEKDEDYGRWVLKGTFEKEWKESEKVFLSAKP